MTTLAEVMFTESPVEHGFGLRARELAPGRVELEAPLPAPAALLPLVTVLADDAIGMSVHSAGTPWTTGPTLELRLDLVDTPAPGTCALVAAGTVVGTPTGGSGSGRVLVGDDTGRTVAQVVGIMAVDPVGGGGGSTSLAERRARAREAPRLDPLEVVEAVRSAPWHGEELRLPLSPSWGNLRGTGHGGIVLAVGALVAERRSEGRVLSATVEYRRPLPLTGTLTCALTPERIGRRFGSWRVDLVLPDGRIGAVVRATAAVG